MKRGDRIAAVAERLLGDLGALRSDGLLAALKARGIYGAELSEVWEVLTWRGVAELQGDLFVGSGGPRDARSESGGAPLVATSAFRSGTPQSSRVGGGAGQDSGSTAQARPRSMHPEAKRLRRTLEISANREESQVSPVPAAWPGRARDLAAALQDELRESSSRLNLLDVPVADGQRIAVSESRVLVRFDVQGELPSGEGATVTFLPRGADAGDQFEAEIISVFGSEVTLSLPVETPEVDAGRIRCDLTWLLVNQRKRLLEVQEGDVGFHAGAALSLTEPAAESRRLSARDVEPVPGLNAEQARAVAEARRYGTTWLWGPPGTGKTTTVAAIAEKLVVEDECRVLLVAPTNVAVDVAVGAILRRFADRTPGDVVRLGPPTDPSLVNHRSGPLVVDEIAALRGSDVARRRVTVGQEIANLRAALARLRAAKVPAEHERRRIERDLADRQHLAKDLDGLLRELRRQVCRDASLVAATTHQVLLGALKGLPFDVVIIDEGSMVPTTLAALVAGSGRGHTIVAGDFRQLPPVTISGTSPVLRWLRRSPFEACGVDESVRAGVRAPGLVALVEQHRMRQPVSDMVSAAFYPDSPLVTAESVKRRADIRPPQGWPEEPVVLVDTRSLRSRVSRRQGQWSRLNIAHAQVAAGMADRLSGHVDLAFISPFAPQAKLLGAFAGPETRASTVHRYQGSEAETVVFDAVDTRVSVGNLHPWFAEGELGSDGARLVNVAASRAKDQFVLLADMSRVRRADSTDAVARFLRQVDRQAVRIDWREVVDETRTQFLTDPRSALLKALGGSGSLELFLPAADPLVIRQLLRACAPGRFEDATVWLPPGGDVARLLSSAGAIVRPMSPIRESVLVVGDVVVTASQSLASWRDDIVLTTTHAGLADAVRRVIRRRDAPGNPGSGQQAETCGRCRQPLTRVERTGRPPRSLCLVCG